MCRLSPRRRMFSEEFSLPRICFWKGPFNNVLNFIMVYQYTRIKAIQVVHIWWIIQINHSFFFGEQHRSDRRQQLLENKSHSRINWVVADDNSIAWPQKYTSDNLLIVFFQTVLGQGQIGLHLPASLSLHDLFELGLALGEDLFSDLLVIAFDFDVDISFHHPEHSLNLMSGTWTISFSMRASYMHESPVNYLNF